MLTLTLASLLSRFGKARLRTYTKFNKWHYEKSVRHMNCRENMDLSDNNWKKQSNFEGFVSK